MVVVGLNGFGNGWCKLYSIGSDSSDIDVDEQLVVSCSPIEYSDRHSGYGGQSWLFDNERTIPDRIHISSGTSPVSRIEDKDKN